jgi:hypothetical protein
MAIEIGFLLMNSMIIVCMFKLFNQIEERHTVIRSKPSFVRVGKCIYKKRNVISNEETKVVYGLSRESDEKLVDKTHKIKNTNLKKESLKQSSK